MMRRFLVAVVLGVVLTAGVGQAAGPKDYAKGSGATGNGLVFTFNAWSDPANNDPQGSMKLVSGIQTIHAEVTCLSVIGNTAAIHGDITKTSSPTSGDGILFMVQDSDDPAIPDRFDAILLLDSVQAGQCLATTPFDPIADGDITVIDE